MQLSLILFRRCTCLGIGAVAQQFQQQSTARAPLLSLQIRHTGSQCRSLPVESPTALPLLVGKLTKKKTVPTSAARTARASFPPSPGWTDGISTRSGPTPSWAIDEPQARQNPDCSYISFTMDRNECAKRYPMPCVWACVFGSEIITHYMNAGAALTR